VLSYRATLNVPHATAARVSRWLILPPRRPRANPRVIKRKYTRWHVKRAAHRDWPQPHL